MRSKRILLLFASAGVLALICGLLVWSTARRRSENQTAENRADSQENQKAVNSQAPNPAEESAEDYETTREVNIPGWTTYWNKEYGFEFQYPKEKIYIDIYPNQNRKDRLSIMFNPVDETMRTAAAANLGLLLYTDSTVPEYEHITQHLTFQEDVDDIFNLEFKPKKHAFVISNGLKWFCYIPSKTKLSLKGIEIKNCKTEVKEGSFYLIDFFFDQKTAKYFSEEDYDLLVKSFRLK